MQVAQGIASSIRPVRTTLGNHGCCIAAVQGRDANKKLQRAIKAGKIRDKLPSMLVSLLPQTSSMYWIAHEPDQLGKEVY